MSFLQTVENDALSIAKWAENLLKSTQPLLIAVSPVAGADANLAIALLQAVVNSTEDAATSNGLTALAHAISADPTKAAKVLAEFGITSTTVSQVSHAAATVETVLEAAPAVEAAVTAPLLKTSGDAT